MDDVRSLFSNTGVIGAALGAVVALVWVAFGGLAVLLVLGLTAAGWMVGMVLQRPDVFIDLLERLQRR